VEYEIVLIALFGLAFGSFLNVLILRIPKGENIAFPPSHCTSCNKQLKWWHNIPLFSYLILRGKCYYCNKKISLQYPTVEALTSLLFVASYIKTENFIQAILISLVFGLLLGLSIIDIRYKAVPDSLNLSALSIAILSGNIFASFTNALLFAGGFSLLRFYVSYAVKKEALGEADIIIAATIGAVLGIKLGIFAIFLSALIAIFAFMLIGKKEIEIPYIPFLALSLWIVYLFADKFNLLLEYIYE